MISVKKTGYHLLIFIVFAGIFTSCRNNEEKPDLAQSDKTEMNSPWDQADEIVRNMIVPDFPDSTFNVKDYGAVADGTTNNSTAFSEAIKACNEAGGGKVVVPQGKYLTGPIHLLSNVNFHLEEGTEILFSRNTADYLPVVHTSYE